MNPSTEEKVDILMDAVHDLQMAGQYEDDEVAALAKAYEALRPLDPKSYARACEWLRQRLEDEAIRQIESREGSGDV